MFTLLSYLFIYSFIYLFVCLLIYSCIYLNSARRRESFISATLFSPPHSVSFLRLAKSRLAFLELALGQTPQIRARARLALLAASWKPSQCPLPEVLFPSLFNYFSSSLSISLIISPLYTQSPSLPLSLSHRHTCTHTHIC